MVNAHRHSGSFNLKGVNFMSYAKQLEIEQTNISTLIKGKCSCGKIFWMTEAVAEKAMDCGVREKCEDCDKGDE